MTQCVNCSNWEIRSDQPMARAGFGRCVVKGVGVYESPYSERICEAFSQAKADVILARVKFFKNGRVGGDGCNIGA